MNLAVEIRPRAEWLAERLTDRPARDPFGFPPTGSVVSANGSRPASVVAGRQRDKDAGVSRWADCMASMAHLTGHHDLLVVGLSLHHGLQFRNGHG